MIQVREFTNGADVLAQARELQRKLFAPRPMVQAQAKSATETAETNMPATPKPGDWFPSAAAAPLPSIRTRMEVIKRHYAEKHGVTVATLEGDRRHPNVVRARWEVFIALHKEFPHWSSIRIGKALRKNHASVFNAFRRMGVTFSPVPLARAPGIKLSRRQTDAVWRDQYNAWRRARRAALRAAGKGMGGY